MYKNVRIIKLTEPTTGLEYYCIKALLIKNRNEVFIRTVGYLDHYSDIKSCSTNSYIFLPTYNEALNRLKTLLKNYPDKFISDFKIEVMPIDFDRTKKSINQPNEQEKEINTFIKFILILKLNIKQFFSLIFYNEKH